jgi:DNA repair protein RadA/Sms
MARDGAIYVCQSCGAVHGKWAGQCNACNQWNVIVEESRSAPPGAMKPVSASKTRGLQFESLMSETPEPPRIVTGVTEFDRVCGGGVVPGSAILLSGDPGVGKSTLLLDVAGRAAMAGARIAYISGEEAIEQIRARAKRMGLEKAPVALASATALRDILGTLKREKFDIVIIDSVQTLWSDAHEAGPGSVTQVRACAGELVRMAKAGGPAVVLVGHVTKDGQVAGPRVVEHMVDAVLSFEGERGYPFRILRAGKNRFGATDEIGVFEMGDTGLREVSNPSALFLGEGKDRAPGAAVFAGIEGSRPVLVEIQALVSKSAYGTPRRAVIGWETGRLAMVLAVLEARCGFGFGDQDVYLTAHQRARRRSGRGGRPDQLGDRSPPAPGLRRLRRDQPVGRGSRRRPGRGAAQGGAEAGLRPRPVPSPDGQGRWRSGHRREPIDGSRRTNLGEQVLESCVC